MLKKITTIVIIMILVISTLPVCAQTTQDSSFSGNLLKITTEKDFKTSSLQNLTVSSSIGDGAVKLKNVNKIGQIISKEYSCEEFENVLLSWNANTPDDTYIGIFVRARITGTKEWTKWLNLAKWGTTIKRGTVNDEKNSDSYSYVDTDLFSIRNGKTADHLQIGVVLHGADNKTPILRQICATIANGKTGKEINPIITDTAKKLPTKKILSTPAYSQMVRDPEIRDVICNPTTVTTLLNDRGEDLLPEQVALCGYDFVYDGFGNWAFAMAVAGSFGYDCYLQYGNLDLIRSELANGYSVGIDVHYDNKENQELPYVENAPITTGGHILVIRGYENVKGIDYFYVSDSAADSDASALLRYRADQLDRAWNGRILYVIHKKEKNGDTAAPGFTKAKLVPSPDFENSYYFEVNGKKIKIGENYIRDKRSNENGGIICGYDANEKLTKQKSPAKTTMANHKILYDFFVTADEITIDPQILFSKDTKDDVHHLVVMAVATNGKSYKAELTLPYSKNNESIFHMLWFWIVVGVLLLTVCTVGILLLRKKRHKNLPRKVNTFSAGF